jgi:hypothetical protein
LNIHYGERDIFGATRIATLAIDQGRVESAANIVYIIYPVRGKRKNSRRHHGLGRKIMVPIRKCDDGLL